jgi:hypothetical protein
VEETKKSVPQALQVAAKYFLLKSMSFIKSQKMIPFRKVYNVKSSVRVPEQQELANLTLKELKNMSNLTIKEVQTNSLYTFCVILSNGESCTAGSS